MDDEDEVRNVTTRMLEFLGHNVVAVSEGTEAIEVFRSSENPGKKFDMVILDLNIESGIGGCETLAAIKEIEPDIPAVASSGFNDDSSKAECIKVGFNWFLSKPMTLEELQAILLDIPRSRKKRD